jgi:ParB family chromosome partitioning protein
MPPATLQRTTTHNGKAAAMAREIPLDQVGASPTNPRQTTDDDSLAELTASVAEYGLLQPVVVRALANGYELIDGHRRFAAAQQLGWKRIPAVVRDEPDDGAAYLLQLTANLQREDLSPKEESAALEVLVREWGWSTHQVGDAIKRSHSYVSRRLRVFEDPALASLVITNKLPVSTAEELLRVPDVQDRKALARQAVKEGWGRTQARAAVFEDPAVVVRSAPDRNREVNRLIRALRGVLEDVPIDELSAGARSQLRGLWRDLTPLVGD